MWKLVAVGIAGAVGTLSRYLLGGAVHQWFGAQFPYGTLVVNLSGCLLIGFFATLADERFLLGPSARVVILIGFLGAFTTFSSFAYESWTLMKDGEILRAGVNVLGSLIGGFVSLMIGVFVARLM